MVALSYLPQRFCVCVLVIALAVASRNANAQIGAVRGRLVRNTPQGQLPAAGVPVQLSSSTIGYSGVAYSGPDGIYVMPNIPFGVYQLLVFAYPNALPMRFTIEVTRPGFNDINPIGL
jgi:hypothetical protein